MNKNINDYIRKLWISKLHDWVIGYPLSLELIVFYIVVMTLSVLLPFYVLNV